MISKYKYLAVAILLLMTPMSWATPLTFSYDVLGRLSEFTLPSGNRVTYGYDDNGNLLETNVNIQPGFDPDSVLPPPAPPQQP